MLQTFNLHERGLNQHRLAPFMGLFLFLRWSLIRGAFPTEAERTAKVIDA